LKKTLIGIALGIGCAALAIAAGGLPFARIVEMKTYDWRMRATAVPAAARRDIVMVAIDESSIRRLEPLFGRWPWPRLAHSFALDFLARGPARVIAYDVLFTERDRRSFDLNGQSWTGAESDEELARSARAAGTVIFVGNAVSEGTGRATDPARAAAALPGGGYRLDASIEARPMFVAPIEPITRGSRAIAHNFFVLDPDGPVRRSVPFVRAGDAWIPSLGVAAAIAALGITPSRVRVDDEGLWVGDRFMPLIDEEAPSYYGEHRRTRRSLIWYRGGVLASGRPTYPEYSFGDLVYSELRLADGQSPSLDPAVFRDKIVVVGATAPALFDTFTVPFPGKMPGAQLHAAVIDDLLSRRAMRAAPPWMSAAVTLAAGLTLGLAAALLGPWVALFLMLAGIAGTVATLTALFARGYWLTLTDPLVAIALATLSGVTYQWAVEGREKRRVRQLFSRYVSRDVCEQLMQDPSRAQLGGDRREMSVLFSDIRGFTTVSERGAPEVIVAQLNEYFSRMVPIVFAHRGTLDKFVGDMIMALFGAPLPDPDHADHAVASAIEMVLELRRLNGEWAAAGRPPLDIGVGINSGGMVAGNIGSEAIMSYTVIGDNVNLGSRLESLNKQFGTCIIISDATRQLLKGRYDIRPLGAVTVKGKTQSVDIFEVAVPAAAGDRSPAPIAATVLDPS
jgi:adenylate cyclase